MGAIYLASSGQILWQESRSAENSLAIMDLEGTLAKLLETTSGGTYHVGKNAKYLALLSAVTGVNIWTVAKMNVVTLVRV